MDSDVEKIKEKLSIAEVVGGYIQLQRAGGNFRARCPFHREKTPSFMVSPDRGTYMCFGCGERGDIFSFVQKIDGVDFPTALKQLAERAGVTLSNRRAAPEATLEHKEKEERLRLVCEAAMQFYIDELNKRTDVLEYLHKRGVTDETIATWRIGYAPALWRALVEHLEAKHFSKADIADAGLAARSQKEGGEERLYDRFRGRVMFPINDITGRVIAFSGRYFEKVEGSKEEGEPAKYVNSPETELFKKSKVLYGLDRAKGFIRKADCVLMVEGQFDLILSHQSNLPFAVAVSGTALTQEHLHLLSRFSKRLILALDNDSAGLRAGLKSTAMAYANGFDVKIPTITGGKDPADMAHEDPELLRAAIRGSQTAVEFFLEALKAEARDDRAYKKLVETSILPLVANLGSKIDQEHFIGLIANRLGVSVDAVRAEVGKRPTLEAATEEVQDEKVPEAPLSQLEHTSLMLMFYFEHDPQVEKTLKGVLGEGYTPLQEKHQANAERFRFSFENLGDDKETSKKALIETLNRARIARDIADVTRELRLSSGTEASALLQKLTSLKREEQELRK